jgi:autotransporter-associated beta strand protein
MKINQLLCSLLFLAGTLNLKAANGSWTGGFDATWAGTGNWSATPVPGTGDTATFNAASANTTIDLTGGVTILKLLFDTSSVGAYTIGSGGAGVQTLTLNDNAAVTMNSTVANNELFNAQIVLGLNATAQNYFVTNNSGSTLTLAANITGGSTGVGATKTLTFGGSGNIVFGGNFNKGIPTSGTAQINLAKTGTGTFTVNPTNNVGSASGSVTVNSGTLAIDFVNAGANASLLSSFSPVTMGGGTLQIIGNPLNLSTQTFGGITIGSGNNVIPVGGNNPTLALGAYSLTLNAAVQFVGPATIGAANVAVAATGTITTTTAGWPTPVGLLESSANRNGVPTVGLYDYATTSLSDGTVGTSPYTIIGGSQVTGFYATAWAANANVDVTVNNLAINNNSYAPSIRFNSPAGTNMASAGGGNLTFGGVLVTPNIGPTNTAITGGGTWQVVRITNPAGQQTGAIWQNNTLGFFTMTPVISDGRDAGDNNNIITAGDGTTVFANGSSYTGPTFINGGNLVISTNSALGAIATGTAVQLNGGTLFANASFALDNLGATPKRGITLLGNGGGLAASAGNTLTVDGQVGGGAGTGPLVIGIPASAANGNVAGLLPGTGSIANGQTVDTANPTPVFGTGTVLLNFPSGTSGNTQFGGTLITGGATLNINSQFALGGANQGPTYFNNGTLQYNSTLATGAAGSNLDITIQPVTFTGSAAIDVNGNSVTYAGSVGNNGPGALTVQSTVPNGVLTLSAANSYAGGTTISSGTLRVNNTTGSGTGSGNVTIASGGTFGGNGIITGAVTNLSGGHLAPGFGGIGTNTLGALTMSSGSFYDFEFTSPANDQTIVSTSGGLTVNGGAFNLYQPGGTVPYTTTGTYKLIQYSGAIGGTGLDSTWTTTSANNPHVANPQAGLAYAFGTSGGFLTLTISAGGVVGVWTNDVDGLWTDSTKWSSNPNVPHAAGDSATFGVGSALRTVTLNANESVGGLFLTNANSFVIASAGNTLTLDNSGASVNVSVIAGAANAIQTSVALKDNTQITVGASNALAISGIVANGPSVTKTLALNGAGTNILSAANTYGPTAGSTGTTLSGGGVLQVANNAALGAGDLSVTASSTLLSGAPGLSLANNVVLGNGVAATVDSGGNAFALGGGISGNGALTKIGSGTLSLGGNNSYAGNTTINAGALSIASAANVANTANIILNGGDLLGNGTFAVSRSIAIGLPTGNANTTALVDVAGGQSFALNGPITSAGNIGVNSLTINSAGGSGKLILGGTNTFNGVTTLSNGVLQIASPLALQNSTLEYDNGALLFDPAVAAATFGGLNGTNVTGIGLTNLSGAAVTLTVGNNNSTGTFGGGLTGIGGLSKVGTGTLTLTNPVYSGSTIVYAGGFNLNAPSLTGPLDISSQFGVVNMAVNGGSLTSSTAIYITSATGGSGTIFGNLANLTITNGAQVTANADANGRAISYGSGNGRPGGNGSLTVGVTGDTTTLVTGKGLLDMFYTSGGSTVGNFSVNLNGGTLAVNGIQESTSGSQSGTFKFNGGILKALAGDGAASFFATGPSQLTATVNTGGAIIDDGGYSITIAKALTHGTGTPDGGLTKLGNGTLILTAANTYTGTTTVSNGTLQVNNTTGSATGTGAVNVKTNATLGGSGIVGGIVTVENGGRTLPSGSLTNASALLTTFSTNLTYAAGSTAAFNLSNTYNSGNDQIVVNGTLAGNGTKVGVNLTDTVTTNLDGTADYVLFQVNGSIASGFNSVPLWLGATPTNATKFSVVTLANSVVLRLSPITIFSATASPNPAHRGDAVTFTVNAATTGTAPISSSTGVYIDASTLGGSSTFYLVQSNGTSIYTNTLVVASGSAIGSQNLNVTVNDTSTGVNTGIIPFTVLGAVDVWTGNALPDNTWGNGTNWAGKISPFTGDTVTFAGNKQLTPNLETSYSISGLTFNSNAGSFNITNAASTLTLTGPVTNNSANVQTLSVPVALAGVQTFSATAGGIVVSNNLTDGGSGGLVKAGTNTLTVAGDITYGGSTTVNAGTLALLGNNSSGTVVNNATLQLANPGAISSSALTLNNNSTLQLRADADTTFTAASLTLQNASDTLTFDVNSLTGATGQTLTLGNTLAFANSSSQNINVTGSSNSTLALGAITLTTASHSPFFSVNVNTLPSGPALKIASVLSGNWGNYFNFKGGGRATVTGNLANTSNGSLDLFVNDGTTVTLQGLTLKTGSSDAYRYSVVNGTLVLNNSGAITNTSLGAGNGSSYFVLGAATNIFTGTVPNAFSPAPGVLITNNNNFNAAVYLGDTNNLAGGLTVTATVTNYISDGDVGFTNSGTFTLGGQNTSGVNTFANPIILGLTTNRGKSVTLVSAAGGEVDFNGNILANGTDTTAGVTVGDATHAGLVKLTGTNTYGGLTTVKNGTLALSGSGSIANSSTISVGGGATFDVTGLTSAIFNLGSTQTLSNNAPGTGTLSGNFNTGSGSVSVSYTSGTPALAIANGTLTLAAGTTFKINNTGAALAAGSYKIIATNSTGTIAGTLPSTVTVAGNGVAGGGTPSLQSTNGEVYLVVAGSPINPVSPPILVSVSGRTLSLGWPTNLGWILQTNSVGLASPTNWFPYPGSASVTNVTLTIDPSKASVFFRLAHP